jgi:hypothetical protein
MLTADDLMKQAMMTAHDYMSHARFDIDEMFGEGFARANPSLVAAYMQTAALDFAATFGLQGISNSLDTIAERLDK